MRRPARVLLAVAVVALVAAVGAPTAAARAAAAGCDSAHPTHIGGALHGYRDNRALNAIVGVDAKNAAGEKVNRDGNVITSSGYSWAVRVNSGLPPEGSTDPGARRDWNDPVNGCVSSRVTQVFLEIYPKNSAGVTDFTRYGEASHYYQPITVGADNQILLRLPATWEAAGGNTGWVNGYITYRGGLPVGFDPSNPSATISRVRAFTHGRGPECGVEGFSASATALAKSQSMAAIYYKISYLAGGRCGAASQRYTIYVDCRCDGVHTATLAREVDIVTGTGKRVDLPF